MLEQKQILFSNLTYLNYHSQIFLQPSYTDPDSTIAPKCPPVPHVWLSETNGLQMCFLHLSLELCHCPDSSPRQLEAVGSGNGAQLKLN